MSDSNNTDVMDIDLSSINLTDINPEELPEFWEGASPAQRLSVVTMAAIFGYRTPRESIDKANDLVKYHVSAVQQAFQVLIRERNRRQHENYVAAVVQNKSLPPQREDIADFTAFVEWAKGTGNTAMITVATYWASDALTSKFNASHYKSALSALRACARQEGLEVPRFNERVDESVEREPSADLVTTDEEPF